MRITFEPNKLTFDEKGFQDELLKYVQDEMDIFEKRYLDVMGDIIQKFPHTKKFFRETVAMALKHIETDLVGGVLTYVAGFNENNADPFDLLKAYVIALGMGDQAVGGGEPIYAGPNGRMVYDNYLEGQHPSRIPGVGWQMPPTWNHPGIDYVTETNNAVRSEFYAMLRNICSKLPDDIIAKHIKVG